MKSSNKDQKQNSSDSIISTSIDLTNICPSKLSKRELQDLYYILMQNNTELKKKLNSKNEKNKMLANKLQRLSVTQKTYVPRQSTNKDCCTATKLMVESQKSVIEDLQKSNDELKEKVKILNTRLSSIKPRFSSQIYRSSPTSPSGRSGKSGNASIVTMNPEEVIRVTQTEEKSVLCQCLENNACDENKCKTQMEELIKQIASLQKELSKTHEEYANRITKLELEVTDLHSENMRVLTESAARDHSRNMRETETKEMKKKLRETQAKCDELYTQLVMEKAKIAELEAQVKAATIAAQAVAAVEQLQKKELQKPKPTGVDVALSADPGTPKNSSSTLTPEQNNTICSLISPKSECKEQSTTTLPEGKSVARGTAPVELKDQATALKTTCTDATNEDGAKSVSCGPSSSPDKENIFKLEQMTLPAQFREPEPVLPAPEDTNRREDSDQRGGSDDRKHDASEDTSADNERRRDSDRPRSKERSVEPEQSPQESELDDGTVNGMPASSTPLKDKIFQDEILIDPEVAVREDYDRGKDSDLHGSLSRSVEPAQESGMLDKRLASVKPASSTPLKNKDKIIISSGDSIREEPDLNGDSERREDSNCREPSGVSDHREDTNRREVSDLSGVSDRRGDFNRRKVSDRRGDFERRGESERRRESDRRGNIEHVVNKALLGQSGQPPQTPEMTTAKKGDDSGYAEPSHVDEDEDKNALLKLNLLLLDKVTDMQNQLDQLRNSMFGSTARTQDDQAAIAPGDVRFIKSAGSSKTTPSAEMYVVGSENQRTTNPETQAGILSVKIPNQKKPEFRDVDYDRDLQQSMKQSKKYINGADSLASRLLETTPKDVDHREYSENLEKRRIEAERPEIVNTDNRDQIPGPLPVKPALSDKKYTASNPATGEAKQISNSSESLIVQTKDSMTLLNKMIHKPTKENEQWPQTLDLKAEARKRKGLEPAEDKKRKSLDTTGERKVTGMAEVKDLLFDEDKMPSYSKKSTNQNKNFYETNNNLEKTDQKLQESPPGMNVQYTKDIQPTSRKKDSSPNIKEVIADLNARFMKEHQIEENEVAPSDTLNAKDSVTFTKNLTAETNGMNLKEKGVAPEPQKLKGSLVTCSCWKKKPDAKKSKVECMCVDESSNSDLQGVMKTLNNKDAPIISNAKNVRKISNAKKSDTENLQKPNALKNPISSNAANVKTQDIYNLEKSDKNPAQFEKKESGIDNNQYSHTPGADDLIDSKSCCSWPTGYKESQTNINLEITPIQNFYDPSVNTNLNDVEKIIQREEKMPVKDVKTRTVMENKPSYVMEGRTSFVMEPKMPVPSEKKGYDHLDLPKGTENLNNEQKRVMHEMRDSSSHGKTYIIKCSADVIKCSRATSPDNTDREISSMSDLPSEKDTTIGIPKCKKCIPIALAAAASLSAGEDKATATYTDSSTMPTELSLSEGEMPQSGFRPGGFVETRESITNRDPKSEVHAEGKRPSEESSPTLKMEHALQAISEELARCRRLLLQTRSQEIEISKPGVREVPAKKEIVCEERRSSGSNRNYNGRISLRDVEGISLRAAEGHSRIGDTYTPHVMFTLHIGTVVLSDEAVINSRDMSLVLTWKFYDQNVALTRMRSGRVVHFDFSTEYDLKLTDEFMDYLKTEELPIKICEVSRLDSPLASCSLPLREALLHTNRRADLSLALVAGPWLQRTSPATLDAGDEMGVLDLWCMLRAEPRLLPRINTAIARTPRRSSPMLTSRMRSAMGGYNPIMSQINEDELDDVRLSTDLEPMPMDRLPQPSNDNFNDRGVQTGATKTKHDSLNGNYGYRDSSWTAIRRPSSRHFSNFSEATTVSAQKRLSVTRPDGRQYPMNPQPMLIPNSPTQSTAPYNPDNNITSLPNDNIKAQVSFENEMASLDETRRSSGIIVNEVPTNIKSKKELKQALEERKFMENPQKLFQDDEIPRTDRRLSPGSISLKSVLGRHLKDKRDIQNVNNIKTSSNDLVDFLNNASNNQTLIKKSDAIDRRPSISMDFSKREGIPKINGTKKAMEAFKKVQIKNEATPLPPEQNRTNTLEYTEQFRNPTIDITILWLALNEECSAINDPNVQRLYVAYTFLGRRGADLETPMSLPKPKQYQDKCYFNFKKSFPLTEAELPMLGRMAKCCGPEKNPPDPDECIIFTVVSEPIEDPLGLNNCEDIANAYLFLGDLLTYSVDSDTYTEVLPMITAQTEDNICGVLAVRIDGLDVVRKCLILASGPYIPHDTSFHRKLENH